MINALLYKSSNNSMSALYKFQQLKKYPILQKFQQLEEYFILHRFQQ